ncbi:hypothetical protein RUM44_010510 [Polyplax serrata]|uniref:Target of rapamycin complex subunit lst8 n=1 Tax=Polyplax serrata TaxID=468196 RepID=A0ABR1AX92_POLSC
MSLKVVKNCDREKKHGCNVSNIVCHGDLVVTGSDDGKIKIWKSDLELLSEMEAPAGILSMTTSENLLYTCTTDESIRSWDLGTGKSSGTFTSSLYQPQKLFMDPSTKVLWAGDSQGNVAKFEGGKQTGKFELVEEIWDLMVYGNTVYTARDRDVVVAEVVYGAHVPRVTIKATLQGRSPFCIAGNHFCFLNREGRNINVHENKMAEKFPLSKEIVASELIINALTSSGDNVVYSGGYDSTVKKWDLKSSNCLGSVNLGCCINALASKSENEVYVARSDGIVTKIGG